jgi:serine/threonine protein kinase
VSDELREGSRVGRYSIVAVLGRGGAGTVYRALDVPADTPVALKLFPTPFEGATAARFKNEVLTLSRLIHPSIVRLLDFGLLDDGRPYFVSELVEGESLRQLSNRASLAVEDAAEIVLQIGEALTYVHEKGVVHGDLKPSNVMLTDGGKVVLLDFGIAAPIGEASLSRKLAGTPGYMPPEIVARQAPRPPGDMYSLGVIAYELLCGRLIMTSGKIDPVYAHNRAVPRLLEALVLRSLEQDPDKRPTAAKLSAAIRGFFPVRRDLSPSRFRSANLDWAGQPDPTTLDDPTTLEDLDETRRRGVPGDAFDDPEAFDVLIMTGVGRVFHPIHGSATLGRGSSCEILLPDPLLSRHHARLYAAGGAVFVEDNGSTNGTFVNGRRLKGKEPVRLAEGDEITLGDTRIAVMQPRSRARAEAQRRLASLGDTWARLVAATDETFVEQSRALVGGLLREAIGFRVEREVPLQPGVLGFLVEAPMLWIRHTRFPILFLLEDDDPALVDRLARYLQSNQLLGYFVVIVLVSAREDAVTARSLRERINGSPYRYDFVVLDRAQLEVLAATNDPQRFVEMVVEQATDPGSLSPYVVRGPVPENMFFGRELEVKTLTQGVGSRSLAVVAGRRMGKSSTLLRVQRALATDPRYQPTYLSCEDRVTWSDFLAMLDARATDGPDEPQALRERVIALREEAGDRSLVFLLDEFDALLEHDAAHGGRLSRTLRAMAHEGLCRFIFSGGRTLYRHLHDAGSPFFNFCEELLLRPLDAKAVSAIVLKPMRQLGLKLPDPERLVTEVVRVTSRHPNLVQIVCHGLVAGNLDRRVAADQVGQIAAARDFQRSFIEAVWSDANSFERLVSLLSPGPNFMAAELEAELGRRGLAGAGRVPEALDMLELYSIVAPQANGFAFALEAFPATVRRSHDVDALIKTLAEEATR